MKFYNATLLIAAGVFLVGCQISKPQALINYQWDKYRPECLAEGYEPVTKELDECISAKIEKREPNIIGSIEKAADFAGEALGKGLKAYGKSRENLSEQYSTEDSNSAWRFPDRPDLGAVEDGDAIYDSRNGNWYRRSGNILTDDYGNVCQKIGPHLVCN